MWQVLSDDRSSDWIPLTEGRTVRVWGLTSSYIGELQTRGKLDISRIYRLADS